MDLKVRRGAHVGSDHYLVVGKIKLKLAAIKERKKEMGMDMELLKSSETKEKFVLELRNQLEILSRIQEIRYVGEEEGLKIQRLWKNIETTYKKVLKIRRRRRQRWISEGMVKLVDGRNALYKKMLNTRSERSVKNRTSTDR